MQKKGANISLKGYDDIFSTDQSRAEAQQERVQEIPLSELHPFEGHPFRVVDDEEMMKTVESVRDFGVLTPAIVRPDPYGVILSRLVDTFFSRISLTMQPPPKPHSTACVLPWEEGRHWQSRSSGCSSS